MNSKEFKEKQEFLGLSNKGMSLLCKVSVRAIESWRAGVRPVPNTVEALLSFYKKPIHKK